MNWESYAKKLMFLPCTSLLQVLAHKKIELASKNWRDISSSFAGQIENQLLFFLYSDLNWTFYPCKLNCIRVFLFFSYTLSMFTL